MHLTICTFCRKQVLKELASTSADKAVKKELKGWDWPWVFRTEGP